MENKKITSFWNEMYKEMKPQKIGVEDFDRNDALNLIVEKYFNLLDQVKFLDFGCGLDLMNLFVETIDKDDKLISSLGIDPSKNCIDFINECLKLSSFAKVKFVIGKKDVLKDIPNSSFDLLFCSNVLDCLPVEINSSILEELSRIQVSNSYFILKVNFLVSEEAAKRNGLEIREDGYYQNDTFRLLSKEDEYWIDLFRNSNYSLVEKSLYERIPNGPKDRIFVFKKN